MIAYDPNVRLNVEPDLARWSEAVDGWPVGFTATDTVGVQAQPVDVVDTVGAGDTFQAALLCWLSEQGLLSPKAVSTLTARNAKHALDFAASAAAITCSRRGADLPRRVELPATPSRG